MAPPWFKKVALVAVVLVGAHVFASLVVPRIVNADRFRPDIERRLGRAFDAPVSLGGLTLSLWLGPVVTARDLRVGQAAAGAALLEAESVAVRLSVLALFRGEIRPSRLDLDDGRAWRSGSVWMSGLRVRARLRPEGDAFRVGGEAAGTIDAVPGSPEARARFGTIVAPGRAVVEDLSVTSGPPTLDVQGEIVDLSRSAPRASLRFVLGYAETRANGSLDLSLRDDGAQPGHPLERLEGRGSLGAATGRFAGLEVRDLSSDIRISEGSATFPDARFSLYDGTGTARLEARFLEPDLPVVLDAKLEGVRVQPVVAAFSQEVGRALEGTGTLDVQVSVPVLGRDVHRRIEGRVGLEVRDGRIKTIGLMKRVAELLEMAGGNVIGREETPFDVLSADFEVTGGRATSRDLRFRSQDLDLDGQGTVSAEGRLDLDVLTTFSTAATADLVARTPQLRFRVGENGRLSFPMKVRGSVAAPEVQLDVDRVLRDALRRDLRREGTKGLLERLIKP